MIRILPPDVANKIAAGEVVERPASVVKELVENAIDAGATRVRVELEEGGKRLIRVTDDGAGMDEKDLNLAFLAHATSKITNADDLFHVISYGFRGEALASIASISRASLTTRRRGAVLGSRILCEGGRLGEIQEAGAPEGTVVEVRDLFFNTPARRKFLKSDGAEVAAVSEILTRIALSRDDLQLELLHMGRSVFACDPAATFEKRVLSVFGRELSGRLAAVEERHEGVGVSGLIGLPEAARPSASRQYLYVNDRFVKDRGLVAAVLRGFDGFLIPRRHPVFFLRLEIDPGTVDVNVHPMKIEVRFREKDRVFAAVHRGVRAALAAARPSGRLQGLLAEERPQRAERVSEAEAGLFGSLGYEAGPGRPFPISPVLPPSRPREVDAGDLARERRDDAQPAAGAWPAEPPRIDPGSASRSRSLCRPEPQADAGKGPARFLQIHASYILVEDEGGLRIIDQHALHERMIYDRLLERLDRGERASQRLLHPIVVELSPAEKAKLLALKDDLAGLGLVIDEFGLGAVAVSELPLELGESDPERLLRAALEAEEEHLADGFRELRKRLLATLACRSAVRFNQRLEDTQIRELLEWERRNPASSACPHGRPVRLRLGLEELERQFWRKI